MRKLFSLAVLLLLAAPVFAAGEDVIYSGGTVAFLKAGATGPLDLSSGAAIQFNSPAGTLAIPYAAINSWEQTNEAVVHLGVLTRHCRGCRRRPQT